MCLIAVTDRFPLAKVDLRTFSGWRFLVKTRLGLYSPFYYSETPYPVGEYVTTRCNSINDRCTYVGGFHIYRSKHDALLALKISPHIGDLIRFCDKNLVLAKVHFTEVNTYGVDISGPQCVTAPHMKIVEIHEIPSATKVVGYSIAASIKLWKVWANVTLARLNNQPTPGHIVSHDNQIIVFFNRPNSYMFNPKYLVPLNQ